MKLFNLLINKINQSFNVPEEITLKIFKELDYDSLSTLQVSVNSCIKSNQHELGIYYLFKDYTKNNLFDNHPMKTHKQLRIDAKNHYNLDKDVYVYSENVDSLKVDTEALLDELIS